jgi:transposase
MARTGMPWRDLPREFGHGEAVSHRFRRWEARGIWRPLWARLHREGGQVAQHLFRDRTIVWAHQHAAGARKKLVAKRHRLWAVLGVDFPPHSTPAVSTKSSVSRAS